MENNLFDITLENSSGRSLLHDCIGLSYDEALNQIALFRQGSKGTVIDMFGPEGLLIEYGDGEFGFYEIIASESDT